MLTDALRLRFTEIEHAAAAKIAELGLTTGKAVLNRVIYPVLIPQLVAVLEQCAATGMEKKAAALEFVDEFYDRRIATIDVPGPFDSVVHAGLKFLTRQGTSAMIDVIVAFLRSPNAAAVLAAFQSRAGP